jgi:hypothetical protein
MAALRSPVEPYSGEKARDSDTVSVQIDGLEDVDLAAMT